MAQQPRPGPLQPARLDELGAPVGQVAAVPFKREFRKSCRTCDQMFSRPIISDAPRIRRSNIRPLPAHLGGHSGAGTSGT